MTKIGSPRIAITPKYMSVAFSPQKLDKIFDLM